MGFENLEGKVNVAVHLVCTCIVFIFITTSVPISQFRGLGSNEYKAPKISCLTAFGLKVDCDKNEYFMKPSDFQCKKTKQLFQAAEAFYIIAVVVSLAECLLAAFYFMGYPTKISMYVLGFLNVICTLIPWAAITAIWKNDFCNQGQGSITGPFIRKNMKVSAGYGLTITAWCIQVIGMILLFAIKS